MTTPIKTMTAQDVRNAMAKNEQRTQELAAFTATKKIGTYMEFDDVKKQWLVHNGMFGGRGSAKPFSYNDIVDFELLEDGESITKGGLGRAVAGGLLFGGVGAVVGGVTGGKKTKKICNSLKIKITVNDMANPAVYVNFITTATKTSNFLYKAAYNSAQECLSTLQLICNSMDEQVVFVNQIDNSLSAADEIIKFKSLLDSGIITTEEFEAKKKQLLGL